MCWEPALPHSALQWLFDFKGPNRRLVRWSLELQSFRDYMTIKYREGKKHANVDPLSRAPIAACNAIRKARTGPAVDAASTEPPIASNSIQPSPFTFDTIFVKELYDAYTKNKDFQAIYAALRANPNRPHGRFRYGTGWMFYQAKILSASSSWYQPRRTKSTSAPSSSGITTTP
jgi:hypothetical protein